MGLKPGYDSVTNCDPAEKQESCKLLIPNVAP
jgi:hypothetical protein